MITFLLPLLLAAPLQQDPQSYKLEDLSITNFQPEYVDIDSLYNLVSTLLSRELLVGDRFVTNLNYIYDRILIYDTPEATKRYLAIMRQIDESFKDSAGVQEKTAMPVIPVIPKLTDFPVQEYRVRNLNMDAVLELLSPFQREATALDADGNEIGFNNLQRVIDNALLIRDTQENTTAILKLLEKFDRPAPQVLISAWVLRGEANPEAPTLPAELSKNLQQLIPDVSFSLDARGLLRSAIGPDLDLHLSLSGLSGEKFDLSIYTGPYDLQSGTLALSQCALIRTNTSNDIDPLFQTTTSIRAGEYAVIGVAGSEMVLLVLRLQVLQ